jgi:aldehyde dehydrogenase (NAD+)
MTVRPFLVNGEWRTGAESFEVHSPYDDSVVAEVGVPGADDVEEAIATAAKTFPESSRLPVHVRAEALDHISKRLSETIQENAELIAKEGGKPLKWATIEATRAVSTFRWASEVLRRGDDELVRLDTEASLGSRVGLIRRFAFGPVLGITPFNFPLNLVAHKVAPSLAVGAPIVVKPASATPIGSLRLAEFFAETDLPHGMYQVLPVSSKVADGMARDDRFRKISFTGSSDIGWYLKGLDPRKRVTLELGGKRRRDRALGRRPRPGGAAGGVRRLLPGRAELHQRAARPGPVRGLRGLRRAAGEAGGEPEGGRPDGPDGRRRPGDPEVRGRTHRLVGAGGVSQGATLLTGGKAEEPFYSPTLIADVKPDMKVCREEIFGPVVTISPYQTFEDAIATVNDSRFGLQAGVFTNDINRAFQAHRDIEVGGIIVNDVSAFRADQMPYGGSKDSGFGREGLRYAMEEMTEPRIMVLSHVPL